MILNGRPARWAAVTAACALVAAACGGGQAESPSLPSLSAVAPSPTPSPTAAAPPTPSPTASATPAVREAADLQTVLASSDLSVGLNRVVFGLIDRPSGPLRDADVQVSTFYLGESGSEGPKENVTAVFRKWPVGQAGVYTAQLNFDRPGSWGLGLVVTEADGSTRASSTRVEVREASLAPAIGSPAPRSASKTVRDVAGLDEMTTDPDPDPELYSMTIAEAIDAGKPVIVAFSTPAYCTTGTCGPQLDVVKDLKPMYADRMNFIHVEIWDNPLEIEGDLSSGRLSPTVGEWGLVTEPWTFIIDKDGLVAAKFEGFATAEELEEALTAALP